MRYKFLANIIESNWFKHVDEEHHRQWSFEQDIKNLSRNQLKDLLILLLDCFGKKLETKEVDHIAESIEAGKAYLLDEFVIDTDLLFKFLVCVTLSEYRIGNLTLHPPEMRIKEFRQLAESIGLSEAEVRMIDSCWQEDLRKKVLIEE
jgi:hypothetical protein